MSRPAPVWKALAKLARDACDTEIPGPASGLNAAASSQASGSRNATPITPMIRLRSQRIRRAGTESAASSLAEARLGDRRRRRRTTGEFMTRPSVSLSPVPGLSQLRPQLADIDDRQQRADEHDRQGDGRPVPERVELEGLDV